MAAAFGAATVCGAAFPPPPLGAPREEWAFIFYAEAGPPVWHQRLRLLALAESLGIREVVATPDGEVHESEPLHEPSDDVTAVRFGAQHWPPPPGVPRGQTYRFDREPRGLQRRNFMRAVEQVAVETWTRERVRPHWAGGCWRSAAPPQMSAVPQRRRWHLRAAAPEQESWWVVHLAAQPEPAEEVRWLSQPPASLRRCRRQRRC